MERVCFLLRVRAERLEEYKQRHREVWPEMLNALKDAGWGNYSLFLAPGGMVIGYLETDDFSRAQEAMSGKEINRKWQREMAPFFIADEVGGATGEMRGNAGTDGTFPAGPHRCSKQTAAHYRAA